MDALIYLQGMPIGLFVETSEGHCISPGAGTDVECPIPSFSLLTFQVSDWYRIHSTAFSSTLHLKAPAGPVIPTKRNAVPDSGIHNIVVDCGRMKSTK